MDAAITTAEYVRKANTIAGRLGSAHTCHYLAHRMAQEIKKQRHELLFMADDRGIILREANRIKRGYALKALHQMLLALCLLRAGSCNLA